MCNWDPIDYKTSLTDYSNKLLHFTLFSKRIISLSNEKFNYFNWGEEDFLLFMIIFQMFWGFFALCVDRKKKSVSYFVSPAIFHLGKPIFHLGAVFEDTW